MGKELPQVVIVGAGFGGLRTARELQNSPVHVTLIDKNNFHLFQPLLYQVATAGLAPEEIAYPVRGIFRNRDRFTFRMAEVIGVDFERKLVFTSSGDVAYDFLVLGVGGETNFFGLRSIAQYGLGMKNLEDAAFIRNHILYMFEKASYETNAEKRRAMLTFVIVGGGPTGVESAGALAELVRLVLVKDYPTINIKDVRILLLEALDSLLATFPHHLQDVAERELWKKHVEVRYGAAVEDYDGFRVLLKGGEVIPAHTLIWTAGIKTAAVADKLGLQQSRQGRLVVRPTLQVPQYENVFVIGDAAYLEDATGKPLPMVATVAIQQGKLAAQNISAYLEGRPLKEFVYEDPGQLATIGRSVAVAKIGHFEFSGFFAWFMWSIVHLYQLIGFRNRIAVLINWAWDYFFFERVVRLIMPSKEKC